MSLVRANPDHPDSFPGEPGVGVDLPAPFAAPDEPTRWLFGLNRFGNRPGLARINGLLEDLGHPENHLRTLVVAGTNGKGSTTRTLALLLQAAGHKVLTYTSPHLLNVHERIRLDDRAVDPADFAARVRAIRPLTEKHDASWFETLTALALEQARDEGVDYFCCEAGLGGRLDASNALPAVATLLTTVGLDHQRILGETLPEIAAEKLGLLKRGVPLFCGVDQPLRGQVFAAAVTAGSPCYFLDELAVWQDTHPWQADTPTWDLHLRERVFAGLPDPGTAALRRNVALALLALAELEPARGEKLLPARPEQVLGNLFLPGRYQHLLSRPDWFFDTGHNTQAVAGVFREFLARTAGAAGAGRRILLFGAMHDKTLADEVPALCGGFDAVVGAPVSLPRSRTAVELDALFREWGLTPGPWPRDPAGSLPGCTVAADLKTAVGGLAACLRPEDKVLVAGSCFTVAEVFHHLGYENLDDTRGTREAGPVLARLEN